MVLGQNLYLFSSHNTWAEMNFKGGSGGLAGKLVACEYSRLSSIPVARGVRARPLAAGSDESRLYSQARKLGAEHDLGWSLLLGCEVSFF